MYYPGSENKGADQLRWYREALLRVCFRIHVDCWISHEPAHFIITLVMIMLFVCLFVFIEVYRLSEQFFSHVDGTEPSLLEYLPVL